MAERLHFITKCILWLCTIIFSPDEDVVSWIHCVVGIHHVLVLSYTSLHEELMRIRIGSL